MHYNNNMYWHEIKTQLDAVCVHPGSLGQWAQEVAAMVSLLDGSAKNFLRVWQQAQRVILADQAGLGGNAEAITYLRNTTEALWGDVTLPVSDDVALRVAQQFIDAPAACEKPRKLFSLSAYAAQIGEALVAHAVTDGVPFDIIFGDDEFVTRLMESADIEGLDSVAAYLDARSAMGRIDKVDILRVQAPSELAARQKPEKLKVYQKSTQTRRQRGSDEDYFFTLTLIPTPEDAKRDGIPYADYLTWFFEACDQPWRAIQSAQGHLIQTLNTIETIRITNDDGTDVAFRLTGDSSGKFFRATFCNSVIAKNIPGSEVFSAPHIDGVDGLIVAKGNFCYHGHYMQNLTLRFKAGVLVEANAETGNEHLQEIIKEPGMNCVGEIAFGTNPWLDRHVANPLLVEKIGGSFHFALGHAYAYKQYLGNDVAVDNGNRSKHHWDITTMLKGKGGKAYFDGVLTQDNGVWLDPQLAVLNKGWAALPLSEIPDYWLKKLYRERVA